MAKDAENNELYVDNSDEVSTLSSPFRRWWMAAAGVAGVVMVAVVAVVLLGNSSVKSGAGCIGDESIDPPSNGVNLFEDDVCSDQDGQGNSLSYSDPDIRCDTTDVTTLSSATAFIATKMAADGFISSGAFKDAAAGETRFAGMLSSGNCNIEFTNANGLYPTTANFGYQGVAVAGTGSVAATGTAGEIYLFVKEASPPNTVHSISSGGYTFSVYTLTVQHCDKTTYAIGGLNDSNNKVVYGSFGDSGSVTVDDAEEGDDDVAGGDTLLGMTREAGGNDKVISYFYSTNGTTAPVRKNCNWNDYGRTGTYKFECKDVTYGNHGPTYSMVPDLSCADVTQLIHPFKKRTHRSWHLFS